MSKMQPTARKILLIATIILGWINMPAQAFRVPTEQNLWPIMSQRFTMPVSTEHSDVRQQINEDLAHPKYIQRLTQNARPYLFYIYQQTKKYHMPAELALLPMIESNYIPYGASSAGAVGLWQLMPGTADNYGVKMNWWYDGRRSTTVSTSVALHFLSYLYQLFGHNWLLALAAYNAGPGTVMAAIHYNQEHGRPTDFWSLPLPRQTERYVPKLLALADIIQHPHAYGIRLARVPDKAITATVTINKETSLKTIAHLARTSVSTVKKLNPALRQLSTPPHQIIKVVLPAAQKQVFKHHVAVRKEIKREIAEKRLGRYVVQNGNSLSGIAQKFKTSVAELQKLNSLRGDMIRVNQALLVPDLIATLDQTMAAKKTTTVATNITKPAVHHTTTIIRAPGEYTYIVHPGDNLHKLAREFHTTTYHIIAHNHLKTDDLQIGQKLLLPNG